MPAQELTVTVLGSGTAVPVPDRFPAGYLVEFDRQRCLVDLGPGTLRRLGQLDVDLRDVDAVLLTHYHTDHCADLAALLFALRNPRYSARAPLVVRGGPGLRELLAHLRAAWPWLEPRGYELDAQEIGPGDHRLGALGVTAVAIEHTAASLGYRITAPGGAVASFSGDADVCPGLVELARDADLFVCDSAFPDAGRQPGHLTPGLAAEAAAAGGARRLCLTHFYPECDGHDLAGAARARFGGEVLLAEDLLRWELPARG